MSRVLIVEDEEAIAEIEKDYLELSDFEVVIKSDGTQGLATALNEDFDIMILDVMLPGTDGYEICRQVREVKNTPIIMVSAKKEDIDKIWDRFYKSDSSRGRDKKGSGLGLSITKEVIQAHGENIDVVSTLGVGTEFIFTLELAK